MLAPSDFNLKTQNDGIERVIRALPGGGQSAKVKLQATGTRIVVPQTDGTFRYIDVLRSVTYEIHLAGKKSPLTVEFLESARHLAGNAH